MSLRATENCILHRKLQQYVNGWAKGWLGMRMGAVYCQWAAWMNWVLWGETANQVLSPPSKPTPLSVQIHREPTYKESDREGRVSHWGTEREIEAVTKDGRRGMVTVCESKKEREVWERKGCIKDRDLLRNTTWGTESELILDVFENTLLRSYLQWN